MSDIKVVLDATRSVVHDFVAAAEASGSVWTTSRAPGKWSPSQLIEHVSRSFEESANEVAGAPSKFPNFPVLLRPVARVLLFRRVLRKETFPKARTSKPLNPESGPATPAEGRIRLEQAFAKFEQASLACSARGSAVRSTIFGPVSVEDYARFQELHARHHLRQMSNVQAVRAG